MPEDAILISIFMAMEGVHAYSAFLPSVFTIKTFVRSEEGRDMIREGEFMASTFLIMLSAITAKITKSVLPAVMGLIAGSIMIGVYEFALARAPIE